MRERFYSDEEGQEILRLAARGSTGLGGFSESKLVETAAELGISPEDVYAAQRQFELERSETADRIAFRKKLRSRLYSEVGGWLKISIMLFGINFLTEDMSLRGIVQYWAFWPIGMLGLVVITKSMRTIAGLTFNFESQFQDWRAKKLKEEAERPQPMSQSTVAVQSVQEKDQLHLFDH